jgi:glycosyltransferase involved in cell wall biosynthesis
MTSYNRTLLVEGWHYIPHSYAVVNQFQCLQILQRPGIRLVHRDVPYFGQNWQPVRGLFDPDAETAIMDIPLALPDEHPDSLLRISYPYNYSQSPAQRTCVFGTAEWACVPPNCFVGAQSLQQVMRETDFLLITPSNWSRRGFIQSGADPDRVVVIPHGIDPGLFHPLDCEQRALLRQQFGWNGFTFLSLGSMTGNKGIPLLMKAFAIVAQHHPEARLILKGLNSLYKSRDMFQQLATNLTSAEMQIVGPRLAWLENTLGFADMARLYQAADAYVSPYLGEGFNLPVLEATACGTLVICTRGGSTDDFTTSEFALHIDSQEQQVELEPGIWGTLLQPNLEHLLNQMLTAIQCPDLCARARQAGPAFATSKFTWEHVTGLLLDALFPTA